MNTISQARPRLGMLLGGFSAMMERFPGENLHLIRLDVNDDDEDAASRVETSLSRTGRPKTQYPGHLFHFSFFTDMNGGGGVTMLMPCPGNRERPLLFDLRSPWENGYSESFTGKLRNELLGREIFYTHREAQVLIERWCQLYDTVRPRSALGYRPPAPAAVMWLPLARAPRLALELTRSPN